MTYILVSHDRGPLTLRFPMFLTFGFSGRDLVSMIAAACDFAQSMSLFYLVWNDHISFCIYKYESMVWSLNIIRNIHRYHYNL